MATVSQTLASSAGGGRSSLRIFQWLFWAACLIGVIVFPLFFGDGATMSIAVFTLIYATSGVSWNIFSGYTGYIALGHAVFFGVGCYSIALICQWYNIPGGWEPFAIVPVAGLIAAAFAVPLGAIALRTRRHTFVVITIAMMFIFQLLATNLRGLTNGSAGITLPIPPWMGDSFNFPFYYVALVILVLALLTSWYVRNSKYGLELLAIRDDEDRARGLGVRTGMAKLSAFTLSAFFVGMCGAVWAYAIYQFYPANAFNPLFDVLVALMAFLGGLGTISGPLLGALIIIPLQEFFNIYFPTSGYSEILFGAMFLLVILLLPQGIVPALSKIFRSAFGAKGPAQLASGPPQQMGGAPEPSNRVQSAPVADQR